MARPMAPLARIATPLGVLASLLAPVAAYAVDPGLSARKALQAPGARSAKLPLGGGGAHSSSAARRDGLRALAATPGRARVLISVRSHGAVDSVARDARALGHRVKVMRSIAVVAVTADSAASLAGRFGGDPRVTSIEPDHERRISADPADDVDPETGIPFGWAFNEVRAAQGIAAVGGGSARVVAVIDSGADVGHPDIAGSIVATFNSNDGGADVTDGVGHGTFVTGLISMRHDNGIGGKGVAGQTRVIAIRADDGMGRFSSESLLRAKEAAISGGADIINLSLGGTAISEAEARALVVAFLVDVLPVAAAGNSGESGNPLQFPAAALGGERGGVGLGLSVGATKPDGTPAGFSTHNRFVSVSAPGASQGPCEKGVFSSVPANRTLIFDDPQACSDVYSQGGGGRYAYSEGTSFATPLVSAVAALAWQAERRLQSEQVADVLQRSARQTFRPSAGWNEFTGHGTVDAEAAVALARRYDVTPPSFRASRRRAGRGFEIFVGRGRDRTAGGDELAGGVTYALAIRSGDDVRFIVSPRRRAIRKRVSARRASYQALACDANGNCRVRTVRVR